MKLKLFFAVSLVFLDQISKLLSLKFLRAVSNSGAAFGIGENIPFWLIMGIFLVVFLLAYQDGFKPEKMILLAGGTGNIFDRLMHGKIIDWIKLGHLWFNLADVYITIGVGWMMLAMIKERRRKMTRLTWI